MCTTRVKLRRWQSFMEALGENPISLLFLVIFLGSWPASPSAKPATGHPLTQLLSSYPSLFCLSFPLLSGLHHMIQDSFLILKLVACNFNSICKLNFPLPYKVTYSQGLGCGHLSGHYFASHRLFIEVISLCLFHSY